MRNTQTTKSIRRRIGGLKAKRIGDGFEEIVKRRAKQVGCTIVRIPNGCRQVGGGRLIRTKSPFDFVLLKGKTAAFFDAKATNSTTFSYSKLVPHQLVELEKVSTHCVSGYVVWHSVIDQVVFYSIKKLISLNKGESVRSGDGIVIGSPDNMDLTKLFHVELLEAMV